MPSHSSSPLTAILHAEIQEHGPLPVSRWMQAALYHPEFGYYRQARDPFGVHGDFYTAEQLNPFASMVETCVARLAEASGHPGEFSVIELGAGRRDLRHALSKFHYTGHDWDHPKLPCTYGGLVLAHEFFDAMPVRVLRRNPAGWKELAVENTADGFRLTEARWALPPHLLAYAETYGSQLPIDSMLEVNEDLGRWMETISLRLCAGTLLVFDYGYLATELERLSGGTLLSYRRHVAFDHVLSSPGERDITAHVNFSALIAEAARNGWKLESNLTLREWALQMWSEEELARRWATGTLRWRLQWKQVVFGMGDTFRVLQFAGRTV